jgi:hypothetical protein
MTYRSPRRARWQSFLAVLCGAGVLDGCATAALHTFDDTGPPTEQGSGDAGLGDAAPSQVDADAGASDAADRRDAGFTDAGPTDAGPTDAVDPSDAGPEEAGATDGSPPDASPPDAAMDAGLSEAGPPDGGSVDAGSMGVDAGPFCTDPPPDGGGAPLGPNDVTMLLPRPAPGASAVLATLAGRAGGVPLVPPSVFTALVTAPGDAIDDTFDDFQIIGARFDLCDRVDPGPCPAGVDGRLRLVFQPVSEVDIGLHAFYRIPAAEMPCVIGRLRALAALADDATEPLGQSPGALGPNGSTYLAELTSLVLGYARYDNVDRFTMFTFATEPTNRWNFRGVQAAGGGFVPISIPGVDAGAQTITIVGNAFAEYAVTPLADSPAGFANGSELESFGAAGPAGQQQALGALAQVLNPLATGISTLQCASCHLATQVAQVESSDLGVAEGSIPGWYTSTFPLTATLGTGFNFHMLGYDPVTQGPVVSQRVANETAQVLTEIEQQFP